MSRFVLLLIALLGFADTVRAQQFIVPAERRFSPYVGDVSMCDNTANLTRVRVNFLQKEAYYWNSHVEITGFDRVKEISLRGDGVQYIPRRYCIARAFLNDNTTHTVIYQIEEGLGIIGFGDGIEFCVIGYDRNFAYSPACSVLRPFAERFLGSAALVERY